MTSHILHRQIPTRLPEAVSGDGVYLVDADGRRYLDGSGGAAVSCLGHSHPSVIGAIKAQLDRLAFAHSGFFTNAPAEALAEHLIARAPKGFGRVELVAGGSEAMEAALKLARQVHVERGETDRTLFIARTQSYHGATLGALAASGHKARRFYYEPMLGGLAGAAISHIGPCYPYRHRAADETPEAYGARAAAALEDELIRLGPGRVAGFIAETVVGATMGAVTAAPGYFRAIRDICDRYGVFLILDEVMCGMGRTGHAYACEAEGISPDLITIAKGLGAGYQPIGAVLVREELAAAIEQGSGLVEHGHTYMAHAVACAGALAVQQAIENDNLLANVRARSQQLQTLLADRIAGHAVLADHVGEVRGRGLFIGIELVADRASKRPFPRKAKLAPKIKAAAMARGLMCYPAQGTADGDLGDHVLLAPPFIISAEEIGLLVDRLVPAMADALAAARLEAPRPAHV